MYAVTKLYQTHHLEQSPRLPLLTLVSSDVTSKAHPTNFSFVSAPGCYVSQYSFTSYLTHTISF